MVGLEENVENAVRRFASKRRNASSDDIGGASTGGEDAVSEATGREPVDPSCPTASSSRWAVEDAGTSSPVLALAVSDGPVSLTTLSFLALEDPCVTCGSEIPATNMSGSGCRRNCDNGIDQLAAAVAQTMGSLHSDRSS